MSAPMTKTDTPGIYKRGTKYVATWRDARGKQRKESAPTKASAVVLRATRLDEAERGVLRSPSKTTFAVYATRWLKTYRGRSSKGILETTRDDYRHQIEQHAIPFFGSMQMVEIEPADIVAFIDRTEQQGIAPNTTHNRMTPLRALFQSAVLDNTVTQNPTKGVVVATGSSQKQPRILDERELVDLLGAMPDWARPIVTFIAYTGVRVGEAIALRWHNVDLDGGVVHIRERIYRGQRGAPKTKKGYRTIPLPADFVEELRVLRAASPFDAGTDPVFASATGTALDYGNLYHRAMRPAVKKLGLEGVAFHALRHTYASRLFEAGWNVKEVQVILGHESAGFTLDTYIHLIPGKVRSTDFLVLPKEVRDVEAAA